MTVLHMQSCCTYALCAYLRGTVELLAYLRGTVELHIDSQAQVLRCVIRCAAKQNAPLLHSATSPTLTKSGARLPQVRVCTHPMHPPAYGPILYTSFNGAVNTECL